MVHSTIRTIVPAAMLAILFGFEGQASGEVIGIYTFEQFSTSSVTTPLFNVAPDSGSKSLLATFTSSPIAGAFSAGAGGIGADLPGECGGCNQTLTVALNTFINEVSLAFTVGSTDRLRLTSAVGTVEQIGTPQPPVNRLGGILVFSSPTPFNLFSLKAEGGRFTIDNLRLSVSDAAPVPEPATALLVGAGLLGLSRWRSRLHV